MQVPSLKPSSLPRLLAILACALWPMLAQAQAIDRGREADVLRLLLPYVDDGPVGDAGKLTRIAIRADAIDLDIVDAEGRTGSLTLSPRPQGDVAPGSKSFRILAPLAPTPGLVHGQKLLRAAISTNDDGSFFAHSTTLPTRAQAPPLESAALRQVVDGVGHVLWVLLLCLLLLHALRHRAPLKWLFWLTFAALAAMVRRQVPFVPLHANGHGLEEILVAIGDPDSRSATQRFVIQYGATWLTPLRVLTSLLGENHDQLGVVSSALGGFAAAFGTAAAWRLSRQWLWTALAAALLVFVPVSARVGHSESTFVVAQLLVALALWLSTHPTRWPVALSAVLALLSLGHPIGIGLALGVYLLTLALTVEDPQWPGLRKALLLPPLFLVAAIAAELLSTHAGVADRLTYASQFHIPIPTLPHEYWLWLQVGYAPRVAVLASLAGLWSVGRVFLGRGRWGVLATASLGVLLIAVSGLLVTACVTDGLRYQAPFAPVLAVLLARAGQGLSATIQTRLLAIVLWWGIVFGLTDLKAGRQLDAQGESYVQLRQHLDGMTGEVWLAAPDRAAGHERVVVQMPAGRVSRDGVTLRTLLAADVTAACQRGSALPKQAFVWLDHACGGQVPAGAPPPCAALEPLAGETVHASHVRLLPSPNAEGMRGEFNLYPHDGVDLRLARLRCP